MLEQNQVRNGGFNIKTQLQTQLNADSFDIYGSLDIEVVFYNCMRSIAHVSDY